MLVLLFPCISMPAQEKVLNIGVGALYGIGAQVSYDQSIKQWNEHSALTLGGYLGIQRGDSYTMAKTTYWDYKGFIAPRMTYTYSVSEKLKLYAALMPGLVIKNPYDGQVSYGFNTGLTGGLRVQLHKNTFFFTELGYNLLCMNIGLSFKL